MIASFNPTQTTPYSFSKKLKIYLWKFINKSIFRIIPNQIRWPRRALINLFGGKLHKTVNIHRTCSIEHPWNLEMGYLSSLGENSWIYCLDKIIIGDKCTIGKDVKLITGSHDIHSLRFNLKTSPILIKDGVWITTGAYILQGITLEKFTIVATNSVVTKNTNQYDIVGGNPAKFIKKRDFKSN